MEFSKIREDSGDILLCPDGKGCSTEVIKIYSPNRWSDIPKDFDPEYWARLVEKAETLLNIAECSQRHSYLSDKFLINLLNYIKNGDEGEISIECDGKTIKVSKGSAMKLRDSLNNLLK